MARRRYGRRVSYRAILPDDFAWITRPHDEGEPARHVAELSVRAGMQQMRGNVWRYEPGAAGKRHRHPTQEETFVVLSGTLTMYLGDEPERVDVPAGGIVHVAARTPLQAVNYGDNDLMVYVHGTPPESTTAEVLDPVV